MRKGCYDCAIKHLGQALVLITEIRKGYPQHFVYVIGHLAEAEDEYSAIDNEVAMDIREVRLELLRDFNFNATPALEALAQGINMARLSNQKGDSDARD